MASKTLHYSLLHHYNYVNGKGYILAIYKTGVKGQLSGTLIHNFTDPITNIEPVVNVLCILYLWHVMLVSNSIYIVFRIYGYTLPVLQPEIANASN